MDDVVGRIQSHEMFIIEKLNLLKAKVILLSRLKVNRSRRRRARARHLKQARVKLVMILVMMIVIIICLLEILSCT